MDTHPAGPGLPHIRSGADVLVTSRNPAGPSLRLLSGVSYIKVDYIHPPSCRVTAAACSIHITKQENQLLFQYSPDGLS